VITSLLQSKEQTVSTMPLSAEDLKFWEENGYVVARNVVPIEYCRAAERAVWAFAEMDADDPETWYPDPPKGIMKEIYQHQSLWDNRQHPRMHAAFSQIIGTERLLVSRDRASINPPEREGFEFKGPWLHWDRDLEQPTDGLGVQGILYLNDTPENQGAFTCVPGFHLKLQQWLDELSEDAKPRELVREQYHTEAFSVAGKAGDLVIWNRDLPHGSSPNTATRPRVSQYITTYPAPESPTEEWRKEQETWWQQCLTGLGGNKKEKEHDDGQTAQLTGLGRKLLGVDPW